MTGRLSFFIAASLLIHGMLLLSWSPVLPVPHSGHDRRTPITVNTTIDSDTPAAVSQKTVVAAPAIPSAEVREQPVMTAQQTPLPPPAAVERQPASVSDGKPDNAPPAPEAVPTAAQIEALAYGELIREMSRHFHYPLLARKRGWQGEVKLSVHVSQGGLIGKIRVVNSSGYRLLDHAAVHSLQQISYLSAAADWRLPRGFDMVVPVEYRLIDG